MIVMTCRRGGSVGSGCSGYSVCNGGSGNGNSEW